MKYIIIIGLLAAGAIAAYAQTRCAMCDGTGFRPGSNSNCYHCKGTGRN